MRLWIKILLIGVVVLAFLYSAVYVFMIFKGKAIIINQLQEFTHSKVSLAYFDFTPPFTLEIKNLNIEGLAKVDGVSISVSIPYFVTGNIALNNVSIIRPELTFTRVIPQITESVSATIPGQTTITKTPPDISVKSKGKRPLHLIFKRLNIREGKINFIDQTVSTEGIKITVKDIDFHLTNLHTFPFSAIANFELKGRIPWREGKEEGKIEVEGWFNFFKKDMQATLKIEDIDGIYLYPYYSQWVDLEKARIESANLNFTSNIQGLNNNVTAECHLELADIVRKPRPVEESPEKAEKITDAVLDMFKATDQGKVVLDFTIRTKMDRPEFGFGNIKMAVEDKLAKARSPEGINPENVLMLPVKILEGTVKGATDISKAVIDGTFAVGNELKKAVEGAFKKEPE